MVNYKNPNFEIFMASRPFNSQWLTTHYMRSVGYIVKHSNVGKGREGKPYHKKRTKDMGNSFLA